MGELLTPLFLFLFLIVPLVLTILNLWNLFSKRPYREKLIDVLTFTLGPIFTALLWWLWSARNWNEAIHLGLDMVSFHTPLASWHLPTILVLSAWGIFSFFILRFMENKLPPIPIVICISGMEAGFCLSIFFLIQLSNDFVASLYMPLFPINYIFCSIRLLRRVITHQVARFQKNPPVKSHPLILFCHRLLSHSLGWFVIGFLAAIPLLSLLLGLLVLFGQAPDAAIRAFTETSDWTLSQKISPPPIEYDAHYLCTVAVGGHPKLVKPTRYGLRHGKRIVVNRQLCVANAFEDLIQERTPRFHRAVRHFYDTYGYPLSQKLTTPIRADVVYLLMKPLEWFFLFFLYTFDQSPESRIAIQYTGQTKLPA